MDFTLLQPPGGCDADRGAYISGLIAGLRDAGHTCHLDHGTTWPPGHVPIIDALGLARFAPGDVRDAAGLVYHAAEFDLGLAEVRLLRRIVVPSQTVADALQEVYGVASDRIVVLRAGVPDLPRSAGSGGASCCILSVGALLPRNGHATVIRALARLFDLDWQLTIVGDQDADAAHTAALRAQAGADAPGRVHLVGPLDPALLEAEWQRSDLFVLIAEPEDSASCVAQAVRRGLPVGVCNGGAAAELASPDYAVLCAPGDADQLSKALRRLIFDTALRADMAEAAWRAGQALPDWPAQARRFVREMA